MVLAFGLVRPVYKAAHMISQGYSLETLHHGRELDPGHGEDKWCDVFILTLSYHEWILYSKTTHPSSMNIESFAL